MSTAPHLATLPGLPNLGTLADVQPVIVVDTREQAPLPFRRLPTVRGTLQSGDYSVRGIEHLLAIERKSIADLVGCVTGGRERFERELHRLRGFRFKRLLIVGTRADVEAGRYRSRVKPSAVTHSLAAWEARYDLPVVFCPTPGAAAEQVESWAFWFTRELLKNANELLRERHESDAG